MEIKIGGVYEHYKGKQYKVLNMTIHSESLTPHVYYECLYENKLGRYWVRPLPNFIEDVLIDGVSKERFKLVSD